MSEPTQRGRLILTRVSEAISQPVTKFGGLPVWVGNPDWPRSASTGSPMLFIGQIVTDQPLFPVDSPRIAYLFISTDTDAADAGNTWEPDSGENKVVIRDLALPHHTLAASGPRLLESFWVDGVHREREIELAASIELEPLPDADSDDGFQFVGGVPNWI